MKLRIIFKGNRYHVQKKGWFLWHTLPALDNANEYAAYTDRVDAENWYFRVVQVYTAKANEAERAKHKPIIIAQTVIVPTFPDREAMKMIEEKAQI